MHHPASSPISLAHLQSRQHATINTNRNTRGVVVAAAPPRRFSFDPAQFSTAIGASMLAGTPLRAGASRSPRARSPLGSSPSVRTSPQSRTAPSPRAWHSFKQHYGHQRQHSHPHQQPANTSTPPRSPSASPRSPRSPRSPATRASSPASSSRRQATPSSPRGRARSPASLLDPDLVQRFLSPIAPNFFTADLQCVGVLLAQTHPCAPCDAILRLLLHAR